MSATMTRHDELEQAVVHAIEGIAKQFGDLGDGVVIAVTRMLVHRAVHYAVESGQVEFCTLATLLAEMTTHAHSLAHGENPRAAAHKDQVH
jgi:hypothetical protein